MNFEQIKEIAELITSDFSRKQKAYVFGSLARQSNGRDLDLLFEVSRELFERYCQECRLSEFTIFGQPYDPYSMYWEYYSPALKRWEVIKGIFNISQSSAKRIVESLGGINIDIIVLPFKWEDDDEILKVINAHDPKFSRNIQGDRKLLFEK